MDDAASRFWGKYILKTMPYKVPERARRWYVRHAEVFIKAHSGRRLSTLTADDIEHYLKEKSRSEELTDWQFRQMVDALCILFIGLVTSAWADKFDWSDGRRVHGSCLLIMQPSRDVPPCGLQLQTPAERRASMTWAHQKQAP